jgi:hypothetical protein
MFDQIVGLFFIIQRQCVVRLLTDDLHAGEVVPQRKKMTEHTVEDLLEWNDVEYDERIHIKMGMKRVDGGKDPLAYSSGMTQHILPHRVAGVALVYLCATHPLSGVVYDLLVFLERFGREQTHPRPLNSRRFHAQAVPLLQVLPT